MDNLTQEEFIDLLKNSIILVNFTKVNNDIRVMECTLMKEYVTIPPKSNTPPNKESDQIRVWSIDDQGWRSFRYMNLNSYSVLE